MQPNIEQKGGHIENILGSEEDKVSDRASQFCCCSKKGYRTHINTQACLCFGKALLTGLGFRPDLVSRLELTPPGLADPFTCFSSMTLVFPTSHITF